MVNLLVVEDDEYHLRFCIDILQRLGDGINVIAARSGEEAIEILSRQTIDGVFVDIALPGISGFALVDEIRSTENYHFLPIVFASGTDNDYSDTYKKYHNLDYIPKPYNDRQFTEIALRFIKEIESQRKLLRKKEERMVSFCHDGGYAQVRLEDILFAATGEKNKTMIVTRSETYYRSRYTLGNTITEISDDMFVKCHKAFAINVTNIEEIKPAPYTYKTWDISFRGAPGKTCLMSAKHRKDILSLLDIRRGHGQKGVEP